MPYKKGKRVKRRTHKEDMEDMKQKLEAPKSIVFCRGRVGREVNQLMLEWRECMKPFTAEKLKVVKRNKVKDVVDLAKHFGCQTVHVFTCSPSGTQFRVLRSPVGPTLTFRVESFKLRSDIMRESGRSSKFAVTDAASFSKPPLLVFNQFNTGENQHQLIMSIFQGMFPSIHVDNFKLSHCHRVVLIHYNKAHDMIEIRHYGILARSAGVSTAAKKLSRNVVPKRMGELDNIEDLFKKGGDYLSDTDGEGEEVELSQNFRKQAGGSQTRLKLTEIGPRMTVSLLRVEAGFWGGETIYHKLYDKTPEEACETAKRIKMRARLKQMRKSEQEANVAKKKSAAEAKKASREEKKRKREEEGGDDENEDEGDFEVMGAGGPEDDDVDYDDAEGQDDEGGAQDGKSRRVTIDTGSPDMEVDGEEGDDDNEEDAYPEADEPQPRKKRKTVSRGKRKQIRDWKLLENQRDEQ